MKKLAYLFLLVCCFYSASSQLHYPETRKVDTVDHYHGTAITNSYRWLEDDNSEETKKWVKKQNALTFGYLSTIP